MTITVLSSYDYLEDRKSYYVLGTSDIQEWVKIRWLLSPFPSVSVMWFGSVSNMIEYDIQWALQKSIFSRGP